MFPKKSSIGKEGNFRRFCVRRPQRQQVGIHHRRPGEMPAVQIQSDFSQCTMYGKLSYVMNRELPFSVATPMRSTSHGTAPSLLGGEVLDHRTKIYLNIFSEI